MRWIRSYADHPAYIRAMEQTIREELEKQNVDEAEAILLFSAHGLPQAYIKEGDIYEKECQRSFLALKDLFPKPFWEYHDQILAE